MTDPNPLPAKQLRKVRMPRVHVGRLIRFAMRALRPRIRQTPTANPRTPS